MTSDNILQVRGLTKSFSGVKALDDVQLTIRKGEVHALMGENGAGKSTLMKILIGLHSPDSGEILFEGNDLTTGNVSQMLKRGISMIHQEMLMIPELTVAQNIYLGRETSGRWLGWLDDRQLTAKASVLLERMGVAIRPDTPVKYLSVAEMQMVEIAKAISNNAKVIIMDEPTSALADTEVATLFRLIGELTRQGVAIIYISHKMDEIFTIADTITVLRDGRYIATKPAAELDIDTLIAMMVGRKLDSLFPESASAPGSVVLSVEGLSRRGAFAGISFDVRAGEVLGIAGLMGAGRTEIARAIVGLDPISQGVIRINGQAVGIRSPQDAIRHGIGYVSEDRKEWGFVPGMSVRENLTLASLRTWASGPFVRMKQELAEATAMMSTLNVKATGPDQAVTYLSGGNQQKVVIGNRLLAKPTILILDEPTRGIDIGAKAEIYRLMKSWQQQGVAIVMISSELPEILGMSDRILVLANGRQTAMLGRDEATQETIMRYAMHKDRATGATGE